MTANEERSSYCGRKSGERLASPRYATDEAIWCTRVRLPTLAADALHYRVSAGNTTRCTNQSRTFCSSSEFAIACAACDDATDIILGVQSTTNLQSTRHGPFPLLQACESQYSQLKIRLQALGSSARDVCSRSLDSQPDDPTWHTAIDSSSYRRKTRQRARLFQYRSGDTAKGPGLD